jgi:hypothetical protein
MCGWPTIAPDLLLNRTKTGQNIHIIPNAVSYITDIKTFGSRMMFASFGNT